MRARNLGIVHEAIVHKNDSKYPKHDVHVINGEGWHKDRFFEPGSKAPKGEFQYCGYHRVILFDGTVQQGRLLEYYGQHCSGNNYHSIGICLQGDASTAITQAQYKALTTELISLRRNELPNLRAVSNHSKYDKRKPDCAGLNESQLKQLNFLVR